MVNSRKEGNQVGGSVNSPRMIKVSPKGAHPFKSRFSSENPGRGQNPMLFRRPTRFFVQPICRLA
ncbi:MAG: hypothetical protein EB056_03440 [Verrucomicrobia bacterium]|nr:hypothetical protein [Verrucomicrobiota bacterium]